MVGYPWVGKVVFLRGGGCETVLERFTQPNLNLIHWLLNIECNLSCIDGSCRVASRVLSCQVGMESVNVLVGLAEGAEGSE